jgi:hypothetical protein
MLDHLIAEFLVRWSYTKGAIPRGGTSRGAQMGPQTICADDPGDAQFVESFGVRWLRRLASMS